MTCYSTPLLVTQQELVQVVTEDIRRFLLNLANAESFDEEDAKREYFVRVSLLQLVSPSVALEYRCFEAEFEDTVILLNTTPQHNPLDEHETFANNQEPSM